MSPILAILQEPTFWARALVMATPLLFGVLGTIACERAGIRNYGIEGIFLAGAFAGFATLHLVASPWLAVALALVIGGGLGYAHGILTGPLGLSQPLTGIAFTVIAISVCDLAFRPLSGLTAISAGAGFVPFDAGWLKNLPYIGLGLGQFLAALTPMTYVAFALALLLGYVLRGTPVGIALRACGDNPAALAAQGRSVYAMRVVANTAGAALMALGGASLALTVTRTFSPDMVQGRGWLCLAVVICARWRLRVALPIALVIGAIDAYGAALLQQRVVRAPPELVTILPYVLIIGALALFARRHYPPPALMIPYRPGNAERV